MVAIYVTVPIVLLMVIVLLVVLLMCMRRKQRERLCKIQICTHQCQYEVLTNTRLGAWFLKERQAKI
jgi:hypothetical protein